MGFTKVVRESLRHMKGSYRPQHLNDKVLHCSRNTISVYNWEQGKHLDKAYNAKI